MLLLKGSQLTNPQCWTASSQNVEIISTPLASLPAGPASGTFSAFTGTSTSTFNPPKPAKNVHFWHLRFRPKRNTFKTHSYLGTQRWGRCCFSGQLEPRDPPPPGRSCWYLFSGCQMDRHGTGFFSGRAQSPLRGCYEAGGLGIRPPPGGGRVLGGFCYGRTPPSGQKMAI